MPYFITDSHEDCTFWAVVKEDGELVACHDTKESAQQQMVAISLSEGLEPGGTYSRQNRAAPDELEVGDFVRWESGGGTAQGRITRIVRDGEIDVPDSSFTITGTPEDPAALIRIYREGEDGWEAQDQEVGHKFSTLRKIDDLRSEVERSYSVREVNLDPPAYMRAAARQGLKYYEEGLAGDGLVERTVREARAMAEGNVTADKWVRLRAWIARHLGDLDSPDAKPGSDGYPSAGVVAHLLWGSGPSKRGAQRALSYAEGVVARLEEENSERSSARGESMSKVETRYQLTDIEVREEQEGMRFTGYAALFNSDSQPLPFIETIERGAFKRSIQSRNDIKLLFNHDTGSILASTRAKTMRLYEDERGLKVEALLPNTTLGRDTSELLRRGDLDSMSFGFSVPSGGDEWSADGMKRTLKSVRLHEVSIVAYPAYEGTAGTATVRSLQKTAERAEVSEDELADAMLKIEEGKKLTAEENSLLTKVISSLSETEEAEETSEETQGDMLALKKAKLKLLMDRI